MNGYPNFFQRLTLINKFVTSLLITIVGLSIYLNSLSNGFVADDFDQIVNNPQIHSIKNLGSFFFSGTFMIGISNLEGIYYRPVMVAVFSVIYSLFGANPTAFHLFQVIIHIINTLLIFSLFKNNFTKGVALFLSLIFLTHPSNTEAVVYISSLQDTLFLFFGLLTLRIIKNEHVGLFNTLLVMFLLLLSLLSKETGVLFLIMIPIYQILINKKAWLIYAVQSGVVFLIYIFLRIVVAHIYINNVAVSPMMRLPPVTRLIHIPEIILFYLKGFFYPKDLATMYSWTVKSINFSDFYLPLIIDAAFMTILLFLGWFIWKKSGSYFKVYVYFIIWFIIGLGLHLQIIPLDYTVADRWFYFPMIGLLGLIGTIAQLPEFKKNSLKQSAFVISLAIIVIFSSRVVVRNSNWKDPLTLYTHDIKINQNSYILEHSLGVELYNIKKLDQAQNHMINSIKLFPNMRAWTNLGVVYVKSNKIIEAKEAFQKSFEYGDFEPAYQYLSILLLVDEEPETAERFIKNALKKFSANDKLWLYLAIAQQRLDKHDEALESANRAYLINPNQTVLGVIDSIKRNERIVVNI